MEGEWGSGEAQARSRHWRICPPVVETPVFRAEAISDEQRVRQRACRAHGCYVDVAVSECVWGWAGVRVRACVRAGARAYARARGGARTAFRSLRNHRRASSSCSRVRSSFTSVSAPPSERRMPSTRQPKVAVDDFTSRNCEAKKHGRPERACEAMGEAELINEDSCLKREIGKKARLGIGNAGRSARAE
eukprot:3991613-Pleurochrysis_carterae.AAC.4